MLSRVSALGRIRRHDGTADLGKAAATPFAKVSFMRSRHPQNAPGNWHVDTTCTNCGAARTVAPGLIVERDGQSVFNHQPVTKEELRQAWRARILCPSASVRTESRTKLAVPVFPEMMTEDVFRLGYNAAASYGAHSFALRHETGVFMIDSPRWTRAVVDQLSAWGGLSGILLSHEDDVADARRYAEHFSASVWIHENDHAAAPFAKKIISGGAPITVSDGLLAIPVPGHSRGSVCYLWNRCLFTGDTLAWDFASSDLVAYRNYAWSWNTLRTSLSRLLAYEIEWVFAGHGGSHRLAVGEMRARLAALIERMAR
jgi:glyoxylase-like metal-dependent hydrolase (beta-lactamase superfamily II)